MVTAKWIGSPNFHSQTGIPKKYIVCHWMVGRMAAADRRFLDDASDASAHYGIDERLVHQYVREKDYAFATGNTNGNRYGISIEHAGGYRNRFGLRVKPSAVTHETSAALCAEIAERWHLGRLVVGRNLLPHSRFKATACPGSLDLELIARRANALR